MGRDCYFENGVRIRFWGDSRLDVAPGIYESTEHLIDGTIAEYNDDFDDEFKAWIENYSGADPEDLIKQRPDYEDWILECIDNTMVTSSVKIDPVTLLDWIMEQKMPMAVPDFDKYAPEDTDVLINDLDAGLKGVEMTDEIDNWTLACVIYHIAVHNDNCTSANYEL